MSLFEPVDAYQHNGDCDLMRSLGLRTTNYGREMAEIGTVIVREAGPEGEFGPRPAATVKVEVAAIPAQFFRMTITRPRDESEVVDGEVRGLYEPCECFVIETGSGGFSDYWPTALALANNMLDIKRVQS